MKLFRLVVAAALVFGLSVAGYAVDSSDDEGSSKSGGLSPALTGTLLGGLLGGGIGTAIGSISGHAGTGALIGGGIGAVGGALIGASKSDKDEYAGSVPVDEPKAPKGAKVKKTIIREYDEKGNLISEKEKKGL